MAGFEYIPTRFMLPTSRYSRQKADHAVAFISLLRHTKGEWAGKPFVLLPWQEQIIRDTFGIVRKIDDCRQFRSVFVELPKKQGKSALAAAIALYLLCADGEEGAEIYGCANDRKQASIVFDAARDMALRNPILRGKCKFIESQKRIVYLPTHSFYTAVSSEVSTKFGLNVHGCIFDELLGQPDRKLYDVMTTGSGAARRQPLNFVITTAGYDRTSICWEIHTKATDILAGRKIDSSFYPVVYSAPDEADWTDPEVWKSVNPSLGETVSLEYLENACASAKQNPAEEMNFRQYFLCQWTSSAARWMPMDKYDLCAETIDMESLAGRRCYGGLDLASTEDIAAFVLVFPPDDENGKYIVLPFFWIPADNVERRVRFSHVPYDGWVKQGYLNTTEGNVIHYDFIEQKIAELRCIYDIKEIAYDLWGAVQMSQNLQAIGGFELISYQQSFKSLSPPSRELMRLVLCGRLIHGGHPVLRWMFDNVFVETDSADNIRPSKKKSSEKIDGAVATIMALDRAVRSMAKPDPNASVKRGIFILDAADFGDDW